MPGHLVFDVRLLGVPAELWRRFALAKSATMWDLHMAIQRACGWENAHLFRFRARQGREVIAGVPDKEMGDRFSHARRVPIAGVFGAGGMTSCFYDYDFGDDWQHEVTLLETTKDEGDFTRRLLDGAGAFPPEDCGGTDGYLRCVAAATGKGWSKDFGDDEEREDLLEWFDGWRPDRFDLAKAKKGFDR